MNGSCHCGSVRISVARPPEAVTECRCSICRRYGALWAYYPRADVAIDGETQRYRWGRQHLDFLRCPTCGCVVGWAPRGDYPECAVNARLLDELDLDAVERIVEDDASM